MAEDFRFGIDVEATVSNKEEAIQALQQLKREMEEVSQGVKIDVSEEDINKAKIQIQALEKTINELGTSGGDFKAAFSKNLESVQSDFKDTAKEAKRTTKEIENLNRAAQNGGFSNISKTAKIATRDIQGTSSQIDNLKQNLQQGVGQTLAFGAITGIQNALSSAIDNATELDKIMTDISIVSGKTNNEMQKYRDYAGEAADALGTMGSDYLEASLIYEQQGGIAAYYAKDLADATVTAANISRESTSQMSEYLTATINGFDLLSERGGQAATYITDVLAKLGAASGSDLAEIATGLTRTANTARDVGFEFEEISTMIATVSEVTRRTPETIGNAFKSMLTTFTQLREAGDDELEEFTNKVEEAFKLGGIEDISVFDNGRLREASDIFKDIADRWETMNVEQQSLVSESVAGKYQAETFRAFMNNQERYNELLGEAYGAAGTSAQQQLIYMDSLEAKTKQFGNQWEIISTNIIDSDMFKGLLDDATNLLKIVGAQEKGFQTLATALSPVVGIFGQLFGSRFVGEAVQNKQLNDITKKTLEYAKEQKEANKGNTEELNRQIVAAKEINDIMGNLGNEAGKNFEVLVEEADRLQEKIEAISLSPDELQAKIRDKAREATTGGSGGTKGFQGAQFANDLKEEESNLYNNNAELKTLQAQNQEIERKLNLYKKEVLIANTGKTLNDNQLAILKGQNAQKVISNQLGENENARVQKLVEDISEWKILSGSINKDSEYKKEVNREINDLQVELKNLLSGEYEKEEQILKLNQKKEQSLLKQQHIKAAENVIAKGLASESQNKDDLESELQLNQKMQGAYREAADKTKKAREATQLLSLGYSTLAPILATVNAVQKEQISVQDGVIASMQSVGSMLMFAPGLWTKLAGAATLGLSVIVDKLELFKTAAEKAKEVNDELTRSFLSLQESTSASLGSIQDIGETYERFEGVDASLFLNNPDSTQEDIEAYLEMADKLAAVRPDLVKYYDEEGRAIVDLSSNYEDLLDAQKQAVTDSYGVLEKGRESFTTEYAATLKTSQDDLNKYNLALAKANSKLAEAQKSGNSGAITEALNEIAKANTELDAVKKTISDTEDLINTNIVSPFTRANEKLQEITENSPEMGSILKDFSSDFFNSGTVSSLISSGDTEAVENLTTNLDHIYETYQQIVDASGEEAGNTFLNSIVNSSEIAKLAMQEASKTTLELAENIDKRNNGYLDSVAVANAQKDSVRELSDAEQDAMDKGTEVARNTADNLGNIGKGIVSNLLIPIPILGKKIVELGSEVSGVNDKIDEFGEELAGEFLTKAEKETLDYADSLEQLREEFQVSSRSAKGFNENLESVQNQNSAIDTLLEIQKEVYETGKSFDETPGFEKLTEISPQVAQNIENGTMSIEEALSSIRDTHNAATLGMMMDNEDFFAEWVQVNADRVKESETVLGIDASNAKTLAEYKVLLETASTAKLRELAQAQLSSDQEKDKLTQVSAAEKFTNMTTMSDIFGNNMLSLGEKIKAFFLNILDSVNNTFAAGVNKIMGWINEIQKKLGGLAKLAGFKNDWGKGGPWKLDKSTLADDYIANKEQESIDEEKLREKYINQILSGGEDGISNYEIASGLGLMNPLETSTYTPKNSPDSSSSTDSSSNSDKEDKDKEKEVENLRLTLNQYYKLENALKKIQDQYDALDKKKDAAYGEGKLKLMTQEQEMLVKQTNLLKQHSAALSQEQADIKKHLSGYGFTFNKEGEVRNLNERLTALQNEANKKTGVAKEAAIAAVESLQEEASRYSEITFNLIPDKKKAIEEAKQTFSQIAREKVEYAVQIKVDRYSMQREVLDVVKEMQDTFGTLDEKMDYTAKQARTSLNEIALLQKAMNEVRKNPALTDSDREELLQQYQKDLLAAVGDARSAYKGMAEIQEDFISQTIEQIDEVSDGYDRIIDKSQTMIDKLKDLYGNKNFGQIEKLYDTQNKALEAQLNHLQNSQRALIKYRDTLEKGTDAWKDANDQITKMGEAIDNNLVAKIDLLKAKFEDFSNSVFDKFNNSFGVWGLDGAIDNFDKLIDKSNEFMSTYDKITIIGNKIKSINEEIAKTNDPTKAAELAKYRDEELVSLLNQDEVSQSEYERALKLYEIKQKELALQDRQNASRIAQLVRDENGNMSYEYVRQETDDTQKGLEELNDAKNDLYEFDSKKVQEASKKIFEIIQNYQAKLKELENKGLSPKDYQAELNKLLAGTQAEIDAQQAIVNKWMQNVGKDGFKNIVDMFGQGIISADQLGVSQKLMEQVFEALQDGSLTYQDILSGNLDKFSSSIGASTKEVKKAMGGIMKVVLKDNKTITDSLTRASNKWSSTAKDNVSQLGKAYKKYMTEANKVLNRYNTTTGKLNDLLNKTNRSSKNVTQSIKNQTNAMVKTKKASDSTSTSVKSLEKMLIGSGNGGLFGSFVKVKNEQNNKLQPSIKTTAKLTKSLSSTVNATAGKYKYMGERAEEARQRVIAYSDKKTKKGVKDVESAGNVAKNNATKYDAWRKNVDKTKFSIEDLIKSLSKLPGMENFLGQRKTSSTGGYIARLDTSTNNSTGGMAIPEERKRKASYDTGGYTGTWDNSTNNSTGRMAILHEKEIVLNKYDTSNLLEAVKLQRNLTEKLQNAKLSAASTINKVNETVNNNRIDNSNITQPITIHADFPNANSSSEIEAAFQGLFGKASTFIGKK